MRSRLLHAPLFHPKTLKRALDSHAWPADFEARWNIAKAWSKALRDRAIAEDEEKPFQGTFLERLCVDCLGYTNPLLAIDGTWTLKPEKTITAHGHAPDAAIGWFKTDGTAVVHAPLELKPRRQHLDLNQGRELTPVQQAWDYANHVRECRWIILSNFEEIRLYSTSATPDDYEAVSLRELDDEATFRKLFLLFSRASLLPATPEGTSLLDELLARSATEQQEITRKLYGEYKRLRRALFEDLKRAHSNLPALDVLAHAQTLLDRVLFIAFAEDRLLVPKGTLREALTHVNRYEPRPRWHNLRAVFRWIDAGNMAQGFPPYNGGLFRANADLDLLEVSDETCDQIVKLADYDFADEVSVDVLGHIFEQSISDLEELRAEAGGEQAIEAPEGTATPERAPKGPSKRKKEGVFYTPSFVTRFIVRETIGREFAERFAAAVAARRPDDEPEKKRKRAWRETWEAYRTRLASLRVLDPSCGSGAFLLAAYDALAREYGRVNVAIAELGEPGTLPFADLTTTILNQNLFGVDLNEESVEITKLSLWLRTAHRDHRLTYLERNIKRGNSVVSDRKIDGLAFDWTTGAGAFDWLEPDAPSAAAEIDARWREGFDVVLGNPPYVRQEWLAKYKEHWSASFETYDGVADLYVYFFERGLSVLKPGGRLGFVVSNKWLKAGYAERLRARLATRALIETITDFGHAPIFEDADTFPVIVTLKKLPEGEELPAGHAIRMTRFPRAELGTRTVEEYVDENAYEVPQKKLGAGEWSLEPEEVEHLLEKIRRAGVPLEDYAGCRPFRGILTGRNEAFLIDTKTRDRLIAEDPRSDEIIKKYLRGQDIARWAPEWDGQWMIFARRGIDIDAYPTIKAHLEQFRAALEPRPEGEDPRRWPGRKSGAYRWYEIQDTIEYWREFEKPKLVYQVIQFHPAYAVDTSGLYFNDKGFGLGTTDPWLHAVLNSPLMWAYNGRFLPHMKDEALTPLGEKMIHVPIARPSVRAADVASDLVPRAVAITRENQQAARAGLDALRMQYGIESAGEKLASPAPLSSDDFVAAVVERRKKRKLTAAEVKGLRALYDEIVPPMQRRVGELQAIERRLSDLVFDAYGLTPAEIALLWKTAPPRMPLSPPR